MKRRLASPLVVLLTVLLAGCSTQIPTLELSQYRNAFSEVQQASEEVLVDFAAAIDAAEKRKPASSPSTPPGAFSTELQSFGTTQPNAVEARRTALRTIDKFNNVLVTLAEGKSVEAVQTTAGGFVQAAGKFVAAAGGTVVPGLSAITGIVQTLAGQFEKARLREEFEQAVRSGAPIIDRMLVALIEERAEHLTLRGDEATQRQVGIIDDMAINTRTFRTLIIEHSAPRGSDPLPGWMDGLNTALAPAKDLLAFSLPLEFNYTSGKPRFGTEQSAIADQVLIRIRERAADYEANVAQFASLKSALNNYGAILEKTRTSLSALVDALDNPIEFEEVSDELFQIAFSLKRDMEALRAARRAAQ